MSCDIGLGRLEPCKDQVGGLKAIYLVNYGAMTPVYETTAGLEDVVASVTGTPNAYKYEIKGASTFTQNIQSSRENGTTAFEQVLEITLKKLSIADHREIKLLSYGRPHVIVEDYNGNFFLSGIEHGMDVTGGTVVTGGAMSDLTGYTLSLTGMEVAPANFLSDSPENIGFTVVAGV